MERSVKDSANQPLAVIVVFLSTDAILQPVLDVSSGLVFYAKVVAKHLNEELPIASTENVMRGAVRKGGNRQTLHEAILVHLIAVGKRIKDEGASRT
eukprot:IDg19459t1